MCIINDSHMMCYSWDMDCNGQNLLRFLPFYLPPPLTTRKINSFKKWKKSLEILSFYTCGLKMTIIWYMVPEISSATDKFFVTLDHFMLFYPLNNLKNLNFEKVEKTPGDIIIFTHVYHKWQSYDVWFLRYGAWRTKFFVILDHFLHF